MPWRITSRALTIGFLCFHLSAQAADICEPFRLDLPGRSMASIPIMNQDDSALCYAYIASNLIDAYRFSNGDTRRDFLTSPLVTAIVYKKQAPKINDLGFGKVDGAINAVREYGSCSTKTFLQTHDYSESEKILLTSGTRNAQLEKSMAFKKIKATCGGDTNKAVDQLIGNFQNKEFFLKYADALCKGNRIIVSSIPKPKVTNFDNLSGLKRQYAVTDNINFLFMNPNPQPIAITYCSQVLRNKNWRGTDCEKGYHASMVVGRRRGPSGDCEFLVRNTNGQKCDYPWDCEKGQIWINANDLSWSIRETVTLDNQ